MSYGGIINMPDPNKPDPPKKLTPLWPFYCALAIQIVGFLATFFAAVSGYLSGLFFAPILFVSIVWGVKWVIPDVYRDRRKAREESALRWLQKDLPAPEETDWEAFERDVDRQLRYRGGRRSKIDWNSSTPNNIGSYLDHQRY